MLVRDAVSAIRKGVLPKTVVLWGDDAYIRKVGVRELTKAAGMEYPEMNLAVFEGRPSMASLCNALERIPFVSPTKVVVLRDTDLLSTAASTELTKPLARTPLEAHTLFIITAPGKLDKRKEYVRQLMGSALMVECVPLAGEALRRYLIAEARARGLHLGRTTAEMLAERTQGDLHGAMNELDKLSSVLEGQITPEDIERYTPASPESNVYRIHDLFVAGNTQEALVEVNALLAEDPTPIGFLTMLGNSFRQMLVARACRDANFTQRRTIECICEETGAREWAAKRAYERSGHFSAQKLRANVEMMGQIDFGAKQGIYHLESDLFGLLAKLYDTGPLMPAARQPHRGEEMTPSFGNGMPCSASLPRDQAQVAHSGAASSRTRAADNAVSTGPSAASYAARVVPANGSMQPGSAASQTGAQPVIGSPQVAADAVSQEAVGTPVDRRELRAAPTVSALQEQNAPSVTDGTTAKEDRSAASELSKVAAMSAGGTTAFEASGNERAEESMADAAEAALPDMSQLPQKIVQLAEGASPFETPGNERVGELATATTQVEQPDAQTLSRKDSHASEDVGTSGARGGEKAEEMASTSEREEPESLELSRKGVQSVQDANLSEAPGNKAVEEPAATAAQAEQPIAFNSAKAALGSQGASAHQAPGDGMAVAQEPVAPDGTGDSEAATCQTVPLGLASVIEMSLCARLCGQDTFSGFADFAKTRRASLERLLGIELPGAHVGENVFRDVFEHLRPEQLKNCLADWLEALRLDGAPAAMTATSGELASVRVLADESGFAVAGLDTSALLNLFDVRGALLVAGPSACLKDVLGQIRSRHAGFVIEASEEMQRILERRCPRPALFSLTGGFLDENPGACERHLMADAAGIKKKDWVGLRRIGYERCQGAPDRFFLTSIEDSDEFAVALEAHERLRNQLQCDCVCLLYGSGTQAGNVAKNLDALRSQANWAIDSVRPKRVSRDAVSAAAAASSDKLLAVLLGDSGALGE